MPEPLNRAREARLAMKRKALAHLAAQISDDAPVSLLLKWALLQSQIATLEESLA